MPKIDATAINRIVGQLIAWLAYFGHRHMVLLLSVFTAIARKFGFGSNGWLESQWYLFAAVFLLGAAYTLQQDKHVRVDVLSKRWSLRKHALSLI